MQRTVKVASLLAIALLLSPLLASGEETASPATNDAPAATQSVLRGTAATSERPVSNRLRFRSNGPVCMCGDGLRERDIRRAETDAPDDNNRVEKQ